MTAMTSTDTRLVRSGALAGVLFAALIVLIRVLEGSGLPDATDPTSSVVAYWTEHRSEQIAVALIASFAAVALVWFGGVLRGLLREAEGGSGTLANLTFGGILISAVAMLITTMLEYAAANSAGHVPAQVTQTLSALQADTFLPICAGFAVFGLAAGFAGLRTGVAGRKLSWLSVVAGGLWLTPVSFVAIALSVVYVVAAAVVIGRRHAAPRAALAVQP